MKTFLRLALVVASSVLGVAVAVYLAGPPQTQTVVRPAKLVAQAVRRRRSNFNCRLQHRIAIAPSQQRAEPELAEPPLPHESFARALPEPKPVLAPVQERVARQMVRSGGQSRGAAAPKPEPHPVMLAQGPRRRPWAACRR